MTRSIFGAMPSANAFPRVEVFVPSSAFWYSKENSASTFPFPCVSGSSVTKGWPRRRIPSIPNKTAKKIPTAAAKAAPVRFMTRSPFPCGI